MPPAFFLPPPVPGQPTSAMGYMYDDVWDEVADREYAGYGCLGSIQASTTLTPTPDARATESSDYGFPSSSSLKPVGYTDYRSPAAPGYRDDERCAGRGKVEDVYGAAAQQKRAGGRGGKEEMDWMDKYRKPAASSSTSTTSTAATKNSFLAPPAPASSVGTARRQSPSATSSSSSTSASSSPPNAPRSSADSDDAAEGDLQEGEGRRRYSIDEDQYGERYSDLWR